MSSQPASPTSNGSADPPLVDRRIAPWVGGLALASAIAWLLQQVLSRLGLTPWLTHDIQNVLAMTGGPLWALHMLLLAATLAGLWWITRSQRWSLLFLVPFVTALLAEVVVGGTSADGSSALGTQLGFVLDGVPLMVIGLGMLLTHLQPRWAAWLALIGALVAAMAKMLPLAGLSAIERAAADLATGGAADFMWFARAEFFFGYQLPSYVLVLVLAVLGLVLLRGPESGSKEADETP